MSDTAYEHLRGDELLAPIVEAAGPIHLEPAADTFDRLVTSVIRQQVSMAAAEAIRSRLVDRFEVRPAAIAGADPEALQAVGLSRPKARYLRHIAETYLEHGYDRAYFGSMDDDAVIEELTDIHGVGVWTAKMFLIFCLAREDVFPVEDLGIRNAMHEAIDPEQTRPEMVETATRWRPYRTYAALYLWDHSE